MRSPSPSHTGKPTPNTILVVDDESAVRALAVAVIQDLGVATREAADGEEAIRVFAKHAADIAGVLLDLTMPGMDGYATFVELRKLSPKVKVILVSGHLEQELNQRYGQAGFTGFLPKPFQLTTLEALIHRLLTGP